MSRHSPSRRRFVCGTSALTLGLLAGCTGNTDGSTSTSTSSGQPTTEGTSGDGTTTADTADDATTTRLPAPRDVSFEASTGTTLQGTLYGSGSCGVVLVPQVNLDRESWKPQASRLADHGALVLAIDEGEEKAAGVSGAVNYLRSEQDVDDVVLVGASTGGEAVVTAAAQLSEAPAGVVTLSAAGGVTHAADLSGQKLFVVGTRDEDRFVDTARSLHEQAPSPAELLTYDLPTHGQRFFDSPVGDDVLDRIVSLTSAACS